MTKTLRSFLFTGLLALLSAASAVAQVETGTVLGTI